MEETKRGFYIESENKFYAFLDNVTGLNGTVSQSIELDQLEKILMARDLDGMKSLVMSGEDLNRRSYAAVTPRLMTLKEAKTKGFEIVFLPRNEMDAKRIEKKAKEKTSVKEGFFGKQNKSKN